MGGRGKDARKGERRWWEVKNKKHINQTPITPFPLIPSYIGARTDADASLLTPDRLPPLPLPNHISGLSRRHYTINAQSGNPTAPGVFLPHPLSRRP